MSKQEQLRLFAYRVWSKVIEELLSRKGGQYVGQKDHALANFADASDVWGTSIPHEILHSGMTKHWIFLTRWAREDTSIMRDKVRVSALDLIVYLITLLFWLQLVGELSVPDESIKVYTPEGES